MSPTTVNDLSGQRRQLLRLVDHDVAVGPRSVGSGLLGRRAAHAALREPGGEVLGVHESLDLHVADGVLGVLDVAFLLLLLFALQCGILLVVLAEQFGGLVEQGNVGDGEGLVACAAQQCAFGVAPRRRERGEPLRSRIEVLQEPLGSERQPGRVERDDHVVRGAQVLAQHGLVGLVDGVAVCPQLIGEQPAQLVQRALDEDDAGLVVRFASLPGPLHGRGDEAGFEREPLAVDIEVDRPGRNPLAGAHGALHQGRHLGRTLDSRRLRGVVVCRLEAGIQPAHARDHHARLAQAGKNRLDVLQERARRPDDENTGCRQTLAMRVQQEGGAVQRHGGLACTGTPLHDQHASQVGADDPVLFGLDRGHDVGHPARALAGEGGEQRGLALQGVRLLDEQLGVEDLVVDACDRAALCDEVAPCSCPQRSGGGGLVEGGRLRHAPVEEDGLQLLVAQPDAPDVAQRRPVFRVVGVDEFEPAEGQPVIDLVELGDPVLVKARIRIAFRTALVVASHALAPHPLEGGSGLGPERVQTLVQLLDVATFLGKLG
jgi:hypothetical protein